jgi:hypothetical protein
VCLTSGALSVLGFYTLFHPRLRANDDGFNQGVHSSFSAGVTVFFYGHSKDNIEPTGNVEVLKSVGSLTTEM